MAKSLPHVPFSVSRGTDPCGTQYDISQKGVAKVREGYLEDGWDQPRRIGHISIRSKHPERVAEFYHNVFELDVGETPGPDGSFRVTDGKVELLCAPVQQRPLPWHARGARPHRLRRGRPGAHPQGHRGV